MKIVPFNIRKFSRVISGIIFKKGLGRTLALWFICISVTPLIIIAVITGRSTYREMFEQDSKQLADIARVKAQKIDNYFNNLFIGVVHEARQQSTRESFEKLRLSYVRSGLNISDFVKSPAWYRLSGQYSKQLESFKSIQGYYDLFLIDNEGNIIYTVDQEDDLGTNLFTGKYSDTHFAITCKKAIEEERTVFSDFEKYSPSYNLPAAFIAAVIYNLKRKKIGLLAVQINPLQIDVRMQQKSGLGERGETYLIGSDLKMRSNSILSRDFKILGKQVKTEQSILWYNEHISGEIIQKGEEKAAIYTGPRGEEVLGIHYNLDILGVPMAVIAEVETEEAFAHIRDVWVTNFIFILIIILMAVILSLFLANRIVTPLRKISDRAKRIAAGDLEYEEIDAPANEIGDLNKSFDEVVKTSSEIVTLTNTISTGDFRTNIKLRSDKDELGLALQRMTGTLRELSGVAEEIAEGKLDITVEPKGENDLLTRSISRMAQSIRENHAENERRDWLKTGMAELNNCMRGNQDIDELGRNIITTLSRYLNAVAGVMYISEEKGLFRLAGSYALSDDIDFKSSFSTGEGVAGQAALEKKYKLIRDVPDSYLRANSGVVEVSPRNILVMPVLFDENVNCVIEFGKLDEFSDVQMELLRQAGENIGIAIEAALARFIIEAMLQGKQA